MKELSIEEKAKAYDEALERAKKWHNAPNIDKIPTYGNRIIEEIFPELAKPEDERIRKEIINYFAKGKEYLSLCSIGKDDILAWLEKQAEQKLPIEKLPSEMKTVSESLGFTTQKECDDYNKMVTELIISDDDKGKQKPADKVKPKFKVGDIVRKKDEDGLEWTILNVENNRYYKIANEDYDDVVILDDTWEVVEQVHIWSKEDERILKGIIGFISHSQHYGVSNSEMLNWLKSLKQRIGG